MRNLFVERFVLRDGRIRAVWSDGTETGPPIGGGAPDPEPDPPAEQKPEDKPPEPVTLPGGVTLDKVTLADIEAVPYEEWRALPEETRTQFSEKAKERHRAGEVVAEEPPAEETPPEETPPADPPPTDPPPEEKPPAPQERSLQEIVADLRAGKDVPISEYRRYEEAVEAQKKNTEDEEAAANELAEYFTTAGKELFDGFMELLELDTNKLDKALVEALQGRVDKVMGNIESKGANLHLKPSLLTLRDDAIASIGGGEQAYALIASRKPREWFVAVRDAARMMERARAGADAKTTNEAAIAEAKKEWDAGKKAEIDAAVAKALEIERAAHPERTYQREGDAEVVTDPYAKETLADIDRIPIAQWMQQPKEVRDARIARAKERERQPAGAR